MSERKDCPICGQDCSHAMQWDGRRGVEYYACPTCGDYGVARTARITSFSDMSQEDKAKLSAYLRERHIQQKPIITLLSTPPTPGSVDIPVVGIADILKTGFPETISERLDRSLLNIRRLSSHLGAYVPPGVHREF